MAKRRTRKRQSQRVSRFDRLPKVLRHDRFILDDRRRWLPDRRDGYLKQSGIEAEYDISDNRVDPTRGKIRFVDPKRVAVCRKRRKRRQALFQLQKIGKGKGGSQKKRRMRESSSIKC